MSNHLLAIYDSPDYVNLFLAYLKTYKSLPFEAIGFTSSAALEEYFASGSADILLLPMDLLTDSESTKILEWEENIKEIVYLGDSQDRDSRPMRLNRFRSMKMLLADLLDIYNSLTDCGPMELSGKADIYSVYSLESIRDSAEATISLAQHISGSQPFLYINLDRFSGLEIRYDIHPEAGMSDLIYYYKTNTGMFRRTLATAICRIPGADLLGFPGSPEDLDEIAPANWNTFLQRIAAEGNYQAIFIDITDSFRDLTALFSISKIIFLHESQNPGEYSASRKKAFMDFLSGNGRNDIVEKIQTFPKLS